MDPHPPSHPSTVATRTRNGVDVPALLATLDAVAAHRDLAAFRFRAVNTWVSGTRSSSVLDGYAGTGQELARPAGFRHEADLPPLLGGADAGAAPVELLLGALAACLSAGVVTTAAVRGITLDALTVVAEADVDVSPSLGLGAQGSPGVTAIRVQVRIACGEAAETALREVVSRSVARSAVYDVLTAGTLVTVGGPTDPADP